MTTFRRILTGAALATMAAGLASADSIASQSAIVTFNTDGSYTLTMNKFNPGLGTLTGATLYFFGGENVSTITLQNTANTPQTFDAAILSNLVFGSSNSANNADRYTGEQLDLFDTGIGPGTAPLPVTSGSIVLGAQGGPACPEATPSTACNSVAYTPPSEINTNLLLGFPTGTGVLGLTGVVKNITGGDLANYTGAGTFNLAGATLGTTTLTGGGNNIAFQVNTTATFEAEIDYTYSTTTTTPEPTTMALMGSALLGLGLLGKRFKKS